MNLQELRLHRASSTSFRVMGIDPNSFTGVVVLDEGGFVGSKLINFPGVKGHTRLQLLEKGLAGLLDEYRPDAVLLEGYAFGNRFTLVTVVEMGTTLRNLLTRRGIPWWSVPPSALKKWTTGNGKAKKPEMAVAVKERWQFVSESDDVVDAFALAALCWDVASNPLNKTKLTPGE